MNPIDPWIDPAELRKLAESLLRPVPEGPPTGGEAGYDETFVGYAEPARIGPRRGERTPASEAAGAPAMDPAEMLGRESLAAARQMADEGGLLTRFPTAPQVGQELRGRERDHAGVRESGSREEPASAGPAGSQATPASPPADEPVGQPPVPESSEQTPAGEESAAVEESPPVLAEDPPVLTGEVRIPDDEFPELDDDFPELEEAPPESGEAQSAEPTAEETPTMAEEEPTMAEEEPTMAEEEPALAEEEPDVAGEKPPVAGEEPPVEEKEPAGRDASAAGETRRVAGAMIERLGAYRDWIHESVNGEAFFVADREGHLLFDEIRSEKLLQVARILANASHAANRQAGATAVGSLHVKLANERIMEVLPVTSRYGPLVLGVVVRSVLSAAAVEVVARGLQQVVDGPNA